MFQPPKDKQADQATEPAVDPRLKDIPMDEPIFILRASDMLAAPLVHHWISIHALNPNTPPGVLRAARRIYDMMDAWPNRGWM